MEIPGNHLVLALSIVSEYLSGALCDWGQRHTQFSWDGEFQVLSLFYDLKIKSIQFLTQVVGSEIILFAPSILSSIKAVSLKFLIAPIKILIECSFAEMILMIQSGA